MSNYTKENIKSLIAEKSHNGYTAVYLPVVVININQHLSNIGAEPMRPEQYVKDVSYADKKRVFEMHGFKVAHLSLTFTKALNFMRSVNQNFLDGVKDYVVVEVVCSFYTTVYFVLEAPAGSVVDAKSYVDPEEVEHDEHLAQLAEDFMAGVKANAKAKNNKNLPF